MGNISFTKHELTFLSELIQGQTLSDNRLRAQIERKIINATNLSRVASGKKFNKIWRR
tara:strand:- start:123 stop:296 length:174 start_codon:yes stop_codon:yes gene_type:complete